MISVKQVQILAVFLCKETERDNKNENLHLPRKPESKRKAVVLERSGFYHNLRRNNSVGCDSGKLLERPVLCCDRLLCVSLTSGRRKCNYGLYLQCCEVFHNLTAIIFMEEKLMKNNKNSVQGLIGLERFTRFGVKTDKAEIAFFSVEPTNISVLSAANIDVKIRHLMMLLSTIPDLEILALDSCECFDSNKTYVKKRLQTEQNEAVRKLLQADYDFLDEIQVEMSSARQFMFAIRFRREKDEQIFNTLNRVDKAISEHGFAARRMSKPEIKRMLALFFGTSISGEEIPDIEGETEFDLEKQEVTVNEK